MAFGLESAGGVDGNAAAYAGLSPADGKMPLAAFEEADFFGLDQFKYLDLILDNAEPEEEIAVPTAADNLQAASDDTAINRDSVGRLVHGMIDEMDDGTGWVRTSRIGDQLIKRYPDFDVRNFGSKSLNKFLAALPGLEVEERMLSNGNPIQFVRIRPQPVPRKPGRKAAAHAGGKKRTVRKKANGI